MAKKLANAPLFYAIGQVRYNPLLSMESYIPALQERLRKQGYPDYSKNVQLLFNLHVLSPSANDAAGSAPALPGAQSISHRFANAQKTAGFQLDIQSLNFMTTAYETYDEFAIEFRKGLEIANELLGGFAYVERIGLRFLNAIDPGTNKGVADYLEPSILGLPGVLLKRRHDARFEATFSETRFDHEKRKAVARAFIYNRKLTWPPDLFAENSLTLAKKFMQIDGEHAMLDTDASVSERVDFNVDNVFAELNSLHDLLEDVFQASITDHARKIWSTREQVA